MTYNEEEPGVTLPGPECIDAFGTQWKDPLMFKPTRRSVLAASAAGAAAAGLAACSNDNSKAGGASGAKGNFDERGPITIARGKDTTGTLQGFLDKWNEEHPDEKVTLIELPESADEQRSQFINNAQAKSDAYTILGLDTVWTAEFAAQQWIVELPEDKFELDKLIPATVETGKYFDKLYAVPYMANAQILFYRKDLLEAAGSNEPPKTFEEMYQMIEAIRGTEEGKDTLGFGSQYSKYEGLTVQFSSVAKSAGNDLFSRDGKPQANSDGAKTGLQTVKDGFDKNYIPKEALTYKEEESRQAFQDGRLAFLQNWPYVWNLANAEDGSSQINGKFDVCPLPGIGSNSGSSALGGLNYAISAFAKNQGTAIDFISFLASEEQQKAQALASGEAAANIAVYEDPEVLEMYPFFPTLKEAVDAGTSRPQVVKYGDVTQAIQEAAYSVLSGSKEVDESLDALQKTLEELQA